MRESLERLLQTTTLSPDAMYFHRPYSAEQGLRGSAVWIEYAVRQAPGRRGSDRTGHHPLGSTVFGKPADVGKEGAWHQDGEYWPIDPLATCTVWVATRRLHSGKRCSGTSWLHARKANAIPYHHGSARACVQSDARPARSEGADVAWSRSQPASILPRCLHRSRFGRVTAPGQAARGPRLRYMPSTSRFDHSCAVIASAAAR